LAAEAGVEGFDEEGFAREEFVAAFEGFDLEAVHGFAGVEGEVGGEEDVREGEEGAEGVAGGGEGFLAVDIEAGTGEAASEEGFEEGGFIDEGAAGDVDEDGGGPHEGEFGAADEVAGLRVEDGVEGDEIGGGEEVGKARAFFNAGALHGGGIDMGIETEDAHAEARASHAGEAAADAADADEAEGFAGEVAAKPFGNGPGPAVAAHGGVEGAELAGEGDHEGEGAFGDGFFGVFGDVGDGDAAAAGGIKVNGINANAVFDDTAEAGGGINDAGGDRGVAHEEEVSAGGFGGELILGNAFGQGAEFDAAGAEAGIDAGAFEFAVGAEGEHGGEK